ncbi:hypothetical protein [Microbacterium sp. NPDC058389]|uniref:hypothetical protein n=1 Tax=Microbacterium sp. NPDC058389 TaxID=3346475 RepID=UPI0036668134
MTDRDEYGEQLHAAKQKTIETWTAFRAAQIATTKTTLSEQAKLTVINQEEVSAGLDLPRLRADVDAIIESIQADVESVLDRIDDVDIMQGRDISDQVWHRVYAPFAEILISNGYRATDISHLWRSDDPRPMEWRYYEKVPRTDPAEYRRSSEFRYPMAFAEYAAWRTATATFGQRLQELQKHDQNVRRESIAEAWGD